MITLKAYLTIQGFFLYGHHQLSILVPSLQDFIRLIWIIRKVHWNTNKTVQFYLIPHNYIIAVQYRIKILQNCNNGAVQRTFGKIFLLWSPGTEKSTTNGDDTRKNPIPVCSIYLFIYLLCWTIGRNDTLNQKTQIGPWACDITMCSQHSTMSVLALIYSIYDTGSHQLF